MCTLSWQQHADRLDIVFNRDELLSRPKARPPELERVAGVKLLAPLDPEGGGTWLASNEHGLTVCLLNDYRHRSPANDRPWRSRGLLVRDLATLEGLDGVRHWLQSVALTDYRAFMVVAFSGTSMTAHWLWDGANLREIQPSSPISTSSLFPVFVAGLRRWVFRRATRHGSRPLSTQEQLALHRSRRPWPPTFSVAMRRRDRATRSLTHVRVTPTVVDMNYWEGDPAGDALQAPSRSLALIDTSPEQPRERVGEAMRPRR